MPNTRNITNLEINKAITEIMGLDPTEPLDYCNNASLTMPIIFSRGIGIHPAYDGKWAASNWGIRPSHQCIDVSPLRAALRVVIEIENPF